MQMGIRIGVYEPISDEQAERTADTSATREFHYGQRLRISGRIRAPQTYGDAGVFDRGAYLLDNGISAVLNAKPDDSHILSGFGASRWAAWRARARESLLQHVLSLRTPESRRRRLFSISRADGALLAAMILGERSLLDQRVKLDFQRNAALSVFLNENGVTSARWGREQRLMQFPARWIPRDQAGHCAALE